MTDKKDSATNRKRKKQVYDHNKPLSFTISINEEEWQTIKPTEANWSDRSTLVLQPGWTDLVIDKIWLQYPFECPFPMHNHKFLKRKGHPYLKFDGKCNECGAPITGQICEKPTSFPYLIMIDTFDTRDIVHSESRQLRNKKRAELREKAKHVKSLKFRHLQANDNLDDEGNLKHDGKERPDLNSTAVISKLRHENKKIDAAAYPGDVVSELINLKIDYPNYIRYFSTSPVVIRYWSENQKKLWNELPALGFTISIDASGKFTLPLSTIDGKKSSPIFFYNATVKVEKKVYTLTQMLSSAHDVGEIASWLSAWINSGASIPPGAVVDCALALLNALCVILNHCTYVENLDQNVNVLLGYSNVLPVCNVKRDRAHLIKASSVWKCFRGDNWVKKDLYLRVIAFSLEIEVLSELDEVVEALFVVCQSEYESTQYRESYDKLKNRISTFEHKKFYDIENESSEDCTHESCAILKETDSFCPKSKDSTNEVIGDCSAKKYILQLKAKADKLLEEEKAKDSNVVNPYKLPEIMHNLINLYTQFTAWTNVMRPFYAFGPKKVSTSTGSEIYYRISRIDYDFSSPVSLLTFLLEQMPLIEGATKLGRRLLKLLLLKIADEQEKEKRKKEEYDIAAPMSPKKSLEAILSDIVTAINKGNDNYINEQDNVLPRNDIMSPAICTSFQEEKVEKSSDESERTLTDDMAIHKNLKSVEEETDSEVIVDPILKMRDSSFSIDLKKYVITFKNYPLRLPYLSLEKFTLTVEDFLSLTIPKYVSGNVIDVFMNIKLQKEWKNVAVIPSSQTVFMVGDQWKANHGSDWEMYHIDYDFPELIFLPYCFHNHWCLIILNTLHGTTIHLDPLLAVPEKRHDYKKAFDYFLSNCDENSIFRRKSWRWVENKISLFRQRDGYNCGPIIMHYMTIFADADAHLRSQESSSFNPHKYRFDIARLLLEETDANDDVCLYCYNVEKSYCKYGFIKCKTCNRWAHISCNIRYNTMLDLDEGKCEYCQPVKNFCLYCHNVNEKLYECGFTKCKNCFRWVHNWCIREYDMHFEDGKCEYCLPEKKNFMKLLTVYNS